MFAYLIISTTSVLGLMHKIIHGIILHQCMPFPPFAYLVSKSRNNAHGTLVFGLTNDAQSLMQILYETHLFLGLTCVNQAFTQTHLFSAKQYHACKAWYRLNWRRYVKQKKYYMSTWKLVQFWKFHPTRQVIWFLGWSSARWNMERKN